MSWAAWLFALAGPLVLRVLIYLGFMVLAVGSVTTAFGALIAYMKSNWSLMPAAILQLCTLAGCHTAIGMVIGAQTARLALWAKSKSARIVLKAP